jgi:pimeloyl-ACP methyl ester carboxylesterase
LIAKVKELNLHLPDIPAEAIQYIKAPTMVIIGDFDIIPKHAVEMFRLLRSDGAGSFTCVSKSQLTILPGTTRLTVVDRSDWLIPMITNFFDAPMRSKSTKSAFILRDKWLCQHKSSCYD